MKRVIRRYSSARPDVFPSTSKKIFRKNDGKKIVEKETEFRQNSVKIQMLSRSLYNQVFKNYEKDKPPDNILVNRWKSDLHRFGIDLDSPQKLPDVDLKLPEFRGKNLEEHFEAIANEQSLPYRNLIETLLGDVPEMPKIWSSVPGWTVYHPESGTAESIPFPEEEAVVFDVEVCMKAGSNPTLACAVGKKRWYSWTSRDLVNGSSGHVDGTRYETEDLIPLESSPEQAFKDSPDGFLRPKIIVGHNVSFDRARVKEQYWIDQTGARFLDTMSLHVCVSGVTSYQRAMLKSSKELSDEDIAWSTQSSLNSLAEVYKLYCDGQELAKDERELFMKGSLADIQDNFQNLMTYCARDVLATHSVLRKLFPMFAERFPHPATLAGMLEIGSAYLPVNTNWNRYISEANLTYEDLDIEAKHLLARRADEACKLMHEKAYCKDLWMWDQDWSTQDLKMKKKPSPKASKAQKCEEEEEDVEEMTEEEISLREKFSNLYAMKDLLPVRRPLLPGYPEWYRKLCDKPDSDDWSPGAKNIGTGMQVAPKLLSLCWEGYPLHFIRGKGWGFLVPHKKEREEGESGDIPLEQLVHKCPVIEIISEASPRESRDAMSGLWKDVESSISRKDFYRKKRKDKTDGVYTGTGVWCNQDLEDCCWFLKLPHKDGVSHRVGNPLAKDFINKFSENVLSGDGATARRVIEIAKMLSYWRNNRDRISGQIVVWLLNSQLPDHLKLSEGDFGAIIPQVVVCGTLTRRAMEPTWMTASNAQPDRVGSELRSMVQAPPGYRIVGADVDSQELWIASVLGDADVGTHGASPLGWMTLNGTKATGSDMHSVTAKAVGISRDHAKVINYARIYGAGQNFAERLLKQFNPTISDGEARSKAQKMFQMTKGKKSFYLKEEFYDNFPDPRRPFSTYEAMKMAASTRTPIPEMFKRAKWEGGSESAMFNRLEEIAGNSHPVTPFLRGRLSRALEPSGDSDDRFLPTRVNWVVQSGAVDFLHLMLVTMRWLMGRQVRFCLSFHDEIRYLVRQDVAYRAALAMHVTNLLTRAFCVRRIGLNDLPQSIAFFASVEVDAVLRKEATQDCKTPSNPHGLSGGYGIPAGESLDIQQAIEKAKGSDLSAWEWHRKRNTK
ncbi:DNA polymerase subunit gamma-1, mitochondrial [Phlebotomus argentipes]|uniref:DNA polymerase subunit gamma-1, mitochondrial n=1 Tax=Phlebotomus argentipes TaxID=94469 RepID=UPI00289344B6|nr:DNA polymerase subunit gamma-1, mitochondrial [Phlebotomus argentipes]